MLAWHRSFMLPKNSFSDSARMSLEWSTMSTSFISFGTSPVAIESPL